MRNETLQVINNAFTVFGRKSKENYPVLLIEIID